MEKNFEQYKWILPFLINMPVRH